MEERPKTQEQPAPPEVPGAARGGQILRRIVRRLENVAFVGTLILILLYFILQSSAVQNWLIGKITGYLSAELATTIQIRHVDISFFDNLVLEGFFVADQKGDTLLAAESFKAGLNSNIFSLLSNKLEFNEISLDHARFNIRRLEGEAENNLQFIIDYFTSPTPKPKTKPSPFRVRVQNLRLHDVQFLQEDKVKGQRMVAAIQDGNIRINNLDLAANRIDIQSIQFDGASFAIADFPGTPEPAEPSPKALPVSNKTDAKQAPKTPPFQAIIGHLLLKEGKFTLDKYDSTPARDSALSIMDYNHLSVRQIGVEADSIYADADLVFRGQLRHLAAREQSGFNLVHLEAKQVAVSDTLAALYDMRLETPGSVLGDTLAMHYATYRDFRNFNNKVSMEGRFTAGSRVQLGDIMYFSPAVEQNSFFVNNRQQVVEIAGKVNGKVNRLNGRDLEIRLGNDTYISGNFDGNDMAEGSDRIRLLFDFKQVRSNMHTLRKIIPELTAPEYFNRLGNINFDGTYQIFFSTNHILNGNLITDIGYGNLDMKLDLTGGREKATYSGFLNMNDFDMAKWTGNSDFGQSAFRVKIDDGNGLTLRNLKAKLTGVLDSFYFRGYNYQNVEMNGVFDKALFDGKLNIEDPNIDFTFDGTVNLKDSIPEYDFKADLRRLDMGALNLVNEDWVLSGKVQKLRLVAQNWSDLRGAVVLRDFRLIQDKQYVHRIDSLTFAASNRPNGDRYFILLSDLADGVLEGRFEINNMAKNVIRFFHQYYPEMVGHAYGQPIVDSSALTDNYKINLQIKNTRNLTALFDPGLDTIRNLNFRASISTATGISMIRLQVPRIRYDGVEGNGIDFVWNGSGSQGDYNLDIPQALLANGQQLARLHLSGKAEKQEVAFTISTEDTTSIIQRINLNGVLSTIDSLWQVHFNTSEITLFGDQWLMDEDNYLRFSSTYFDARNFDLMNNLQRIVVDSFNEGRGARLSLANFDLNFLERFWKPDNLQYSGKIYNLDFELQDLFGLKNLEGYITTDTIFINQKPYGKLIGNMELKDLNSPLWWRVFLSDKENHQLRVLGAWAPNDEMPQTIDELGEIQPGELQTQITAQDFPMGVLELFIPDISKTNGKINLDVRLGGPFTRIGMNGKAQVDGQFQLDYLKAMFYIPNQTITLTEYQLWADGDTILDAQQHKAVIRGGLRHDHFNDWRLDCDIRTLGNNFMVLNTLREDNSMYYGQGIGKFEARFSGSFSRTNIYIDAETGQDTRLYIPLSSKTDIQDASFITFRDKNDDVDKNTFKTKRFVLGDLKGLNLEMNLTITDAAEVQLIFDEQAGDIVKGRGEGDIRLTISREGEFKMYGTYQILRGEYLFTLLNWVNKPFTVAEGGTIIWYGDPYGAQISLDATYEENTSLYNLLRDELIASNNNLNAEATKSTRAVVTMHLKGDLFKPNISFDLNFPNTIGQLKSLVDSKLSLLRQDQNELTRQVFGLVVVGSFLPPSGSSSSVQSGDYLASAFNTLTQVLSNQFSSYLTGLASEWFGGTVSSIDFDIAYNEYRNQTDPSQANLTQIGRELQVRLTSGFVNDRITVQLGSQFGLGQPGAASTNDGFLGEDVTIEIQLTQNRQWRLKVYQRTEPDIAGGGARRSRYGFGITFRKDYDTFSDLMSGVTGWLRKKK